LPEAIAASGPHGLTCIADLCIAKEYLRLFGDRL
jgi:hypothetical protein